MNELQKRARDKELNDFVEKYRSRCKGWVRVGNVLLTVMFFNVIGLLVFVYLEERLYTLAIMCLELILLCVWGCIKGLIDTYIYKLEDIIKLKQYNIVVDSLREKQE